MQRSSLRRPLAYARRGFTLMELVTTIVLLAIMGSVSAGIIFTATDGYLQAATRATLHEEASLAMDRMSRELRDILRDPAAAANVPHITNVTADSIEWHDGSRIERSGGAIIINTHGGEGGVLARSVTAFAIATYDESNEPLPQEMSAEQCSAIHRIELTLTLSRHGVSETIRTRIFPRAAMRGEGDST